MELQKNTRSFYCFIIVLKGNYLLQITLVATTALCLNNIKFIVYQYFSIKKPRHPNKIIRKKYWKSNRFLVPKLRQTPFKIRPQEKLDNFAFKNSNIIIEGLFWKRKHYFRQKNLKQKNNFINKFYFCANFFSYCFLPNLKKSCDPNKLRIIFSEKRFSTTSPFPTFENKFCNGWDH